MRIAIHARTGSFSDHWIQYCQDSGIPYKIVDCYADDIVSQVADCDAVMWHHHHSLYKDTLFAKQLLNALEQAGKVVFPNHSTAWHFDDKIGQKYLFEAIGAPFAKTKVLYDKKEALQYIATAHFPQVCKLRSGAGASNVRLVASKQDAVRVVRKAFSSGFAQNDRIGFAKEQWSLIRNHKVRLSTGLLRAGKRLLIGKSFSNKKNYERGYVYFQEYLPGNEYDIRVIVIGDRAYGMKRLVRKGDFRASGSGDFVYDSIDPMVLKEAFAIANRLKLQSAAFDFVYDTNKHPVVIEMSYGYGTKGSSKCKGYYDKELVYHPGAFNPFGWMVDEVVGLISL
ncbi:MAG: ATP-grasp domain-containing protein [Sphaerochaetaceae bacterium]